MVRRKPKRAQIVDLEPFWSREGRNELKSSIWNRFGPLRGSGRSAFSLRALRSVAPAASLHGAANFAAASPLRGLRCSVETDESLDTAEPEPEVVVAQIDGVANDVLGVDPDGFPTIILYSKVG